MKKLLCIILPILIILLSLSACSGSGGEDPEEEEDIVYSASEAAKEHIMATYEGDVGKQYDFEIFDNEIRSKAFVDHAEASGLTISEYYEELSNRLNYNLPEDEQVSVSDYEEYIAMTNIMTYTSKQKSYEETYGDDYKITVDVFGESEITGSELDNYRSRITNEISSFESQYSTDIDFDGDDVTKMVRINFKATISGDKGSNSTSDGSEIILAEINGKWKVCHSDAQS